MFIVYFYVDSKVVCCYVYMNYNFYKKWIEIYLVYGNIMQCSDSD